MSSIFLKCNLITITLVLFIYHYHLTHLHYLVSCKYIVLDKLLLVYTWYTLQTRKAEGEIFLGNLIHIHTIFEESNCRGADDSFSNRI